MYGCGIQAEASASTPVTVPCSLASISSQLPHPNLQCPCCAMHTHRPPLYLHPDVHHRGIQEVEDTGGDAISSVLSKPAIAAQCVLGALGGHGQAQLIHQPAALRRGPIMAQLGRDTWVP